MDPGLSGDPPPASVDEAASILYGLPLAGFVTERDALVKRVRAAGDRVLAADIKALRKPTVAADAVNRAIRADPDGIEALLAAADDLRRAQEAALDDGGPADAGPGGGVGAGSGRAEGRPGFVDLQRRYRQALDAVVACAPGHEVEVRTAIGAAAADGRHDELRAAAFAIPPEPISGFGPFGPGAGRPAGGAVDGRGVKPSSGRGRRSSTAGGGTGAESVERPPTAAERRMADRTRRAAERVVADAEHDRSAAETAASAAADTVRVIDAEIAELTERLDLARKARDDAVADRATAEAALDAATDRRERAIAALAALLDTTADPGAATP